MKIYWGLVDRIHLRTQTMQTADICFNLPRCTVTISSPDAVKSSSISHKNCVLHSIAIPLYSSTATLYISQSFYVHSLSIFVFSCLPRLFLKNLPPLQSCGKKQATIQLLAISFYIGAKNKQFKQCELAPILCRRF